MMPKYTTILIQYFVILIALVLTAFLNWFFPLYLWSDTPIVRFAWLGIFFVLLDIAVEVILKMVERFGIIGETISFSNDFKKISSGFYVASKVQLPNNLKADFVVVGSSGVWLIMVQDDKGKITFNGDDILQDDVILKGLLIQTVQRGYALANLLKQELKRDFIVTPVIAFSSPQVDLSSVPKVVRGVHLVLSKDAIQFVENTDVQLIDKNTIEEIYKILKK